MLGEAKHEGGRPPIYEVWILSLRIGNFLVHTLRETPNLRMMKWPREGGVLEKSQWPMEGNAPKAPQGRIPKKCRKGSGLMRLKSKG